ncbi:putative GATA transcription factor [Talaromyces proteolyticus]|uniref:GATA transcription factor n=1 Tax=Talaromyces proteolyticus TaxID=1131652 RepID=A0AAD4L2G8_9EURO|nr:putative GATA transcription factor [Talaromyces proteolyticus]KAH8705411.1 putative GATA transcription factor [Talaromyces proteolyticus]
MEDQDGITVRAMRLKVLYTFDDENKTNCLARWPQLLDIQTAYLDENTQIGVIELKTCIQAIVSASPELVAKLGQDYTVYAYDYSEYETPLVGQGMLSWVLASASPTPNAPAHQSKTIVTGRVSKNVLGLFSKGAQETLEVKLRLVPVPTVMQSEYLESMQRYRELSNIIPQGFDSQAWSSFVQQNPNVFTQRAQLMERSNSSSMDHSGIERFHQLLSAGSTPREFPSTHPESAAPSPVDLESRCGTPIGIQQNSQQLRQILPSLERRGSETSIRPLSRGSMYEADFQRPSAGVRRSSFYSGYGSGDETTENPPRKRARLFRADTTGKDDLNIEKQPGSLRVAASTAASVRIHRPTPINASHSSITRSALEEPVRPPTPISRASNDATRRSRPPPSLLRESSTNSTATTYKSPYPAYDDAPSTDLPTTSPDDHRYQGIFESQINMPSSPPIMDTGFPSRSSPVLPPLPIPDSGFMSATLEDLMDEDGCMRPNLNESNLLAMAGQTGENHQILTGNQNSANNNHLVTRHQHDSFLESDGPYEATPKEAPTLPPQRASTASRPSSRASTRAPQKLAPAPISQSEIEQLINSIPASDPVMPQQGYLQHAHTWAGSMSDLPSAETPAPQPFEDGGKIRSGAGARRVRQVQARLENCIREGQVPPYCNNCGNIETPTWRRAWSKDTEGSEQDANDCLKDPLILFWTALKRDSDEKVIKFRLYKKTLVDADKDFDQILLCNPCGLWLQKFKSMRPENKWNKQPAKDKRKRSSRSRKGPLSGGVFSATRSRSRTQMSLPPGSSPAHTDASSPAGENGSTAGDDGVTPAVENDHENDNNENEGDEQNHPAKRARASSAEPTRTTDSAQSRWDENAAMEALRRAIQSSPARNLDSRSLQLNGESLTPKPVRRTLFPNGNDGPLKKLGESLMNSPRRSPRVASRGSEKTVADKENTASATDRNLDDLFNSSSFDFAIPTTPTPKRRTPRSERRLSLPDCSPSANRNKNATSVLSSNTQEMNKHSRAISDKSPLADDAMQNKDSFGGVGDMVLDDLFQSWQSLPQSDAYNPFSDWSPTRGNINTGLHFGDDYNDDEAIINAMLSDPEYKSTADLSSVFPPPTTTSTVTAIPTLDTTSSNAPESNSQAAVPSV